MSIQGKYPSLHGRRVGVSPDDQVVAKGGFVAGGGEKISIVFPSPDTVAVFEDFLGHQKLDTGGFWRPVLGTDSGASSQAVGVVGGLHGGAASVKCANGFTLAAGGSGAATVNALVGTGRNFHASQGRMRLAARVRPRDSGSDGSKAIFVGFTDDTGTIEFPIFADTGAKASGSGVVGDLAATASDAFGFLCDDNPDTGLGMVKNKWTAVAVAGTTVTTTPISADTGAVTGKWSELEMVYDRGDTGGIAHFYVNGIRIGSITSPVATTAVLAPKVCIAGRTVDTGSSEVLVDWINPSQARDTGD
jgi:hypothetical protein